MITYILGALAIMALLLLVQAVYLKTTVQKEKFKDVINNVFLVLATFLGVAIAIYFNDKETNADKKLRCRAAIANTRRVLMEYQGLMKVFLDQPDTGMSIKAVWRINERAPDFIILKIPDLYYILSQRSYFDFYTKQINIQQGMKYMDDHPNMSTEEFRRDVNNIAAYLYLTITHLDWEDGYQAEQYDSTTLVKMYQCETDSILAATKAQIQENRKNDSSRH
jgi:hypothetical protein